MQPRENDPSDYVAIRLNNGESVTITNTCAANVLGIPAEGDYARGNVESATKAMKLLADEAGMSVEDTARAILQKSTDKIKPVIEDLISKYKIERDQIVLVGAGGGAGTLLTFTANDMGFKYQIPENAEVISSIGVALAMVREMVERTIPNPTARDIAQLKKEVEKQLNMLKKQYGKRTAKEYLDLFNFHIEVEKPELTPSFLYMGMMVPEEKKILLNETVIALGESRMEIRLFSDNDMYRCFRDIILWHELFHVLEERTPQIYTRSVQVNCSFLGFFRRMKKVEAASEIGAIHFSKLAAGVSFCPYLYTQYLLAATKQDTEVEDEF